VYAITESKNATLELHMSFTVMVNETGAPIVAVVTKFVTVDRVPHTMRKAETVTLAAVMA
jgi:hypothetical protein